jgi:pyrophosphatase PpaX
MQRISCVIFDLDGTLTRTNELIYETFNHVAEKYLRRVFTPAEITRMFGPPEEVAIDRLVGPELSEAALVDFYSFYETHHPRLAGAYEGIEEVLKFLKERGIVLAIFTGKGRKTAEITLGAIGLRNYFDEVVTGSDVANYKPSADGIRRVLRTLGFSPGEALMVGDSVSDVKAAREAGVAIAAVVWDSYAKDRVLEMGVAHVFHDVQEFAGWLVKVIPENGNRPS